MSAAARAPQPQPALFAGEPAEQDWLAEAWRRMQAGRADRAGLSLADALTNPTLAGCIRAFAAQLRADWQAGQAREQREQRYGRRARRGAWYLRVAATRIVR